MPLVLAILPILGALVPAVIKWITSYETTKNSPVNLTAAEHQTNENTILSGAAGVQSVNVRVDELLRDIQAKRSGNPG